MMSLYLRVNNIPNGGSGNSLKLFTQTSFGVCVFGIGTDCVQNFSPQVLHASRWLYLNL